MIIAIILKIISIVVEFILVILDIIFDYSLLCKLHTKAVTSKALTALAK